MPGNESSFGSETKANAKSGDSASKEAIVIEPRMTGLVLLSDPPTAEHVRFRLQLSGSSREAANRQLLFWDRRGLGSVRLYSAAEFGSRFGKRAKRWGRMH